jgi:hypothetical protein
MYYREMDWPGWIVAVGQLSVAVKSAEIQASIAQSVVDLSRGAGSIVARQSDLQNVLQNSLDTISREVVNVSSGIEKLRASFDWGVSALLWKHEMQNKVLRGILRTLQAPLDTQAKELRRRTEYSYLHDWYDEALPDFLESERKNYQDFAVHLSIGNIYLYKRQPVVVPDGVDNS